MEQESGWARVRHTTTPAPASLRSPARTLVASALLVLAVPACVLLSSGVQPRGEELAAAAASVWERGSDFARPLAVQLQRRASAPTGRAKMQGLASELLSKRGDKNPDKVVIKMFMEADCPDCRRFTSTYLAHVLSAHGVGDIVDLEWVPFGNSETRVRHITVQAGPDRFDVLNSTEALEKILDRMHDKYYSELHGAPQVSFVCPDGNSGCESNAWRTCLLDVAPKHQDSFPAFQCMEEKACDNAQEKGCNALPGDVAHEVREREIGVYWYLFSNQPSSPQPLGTCLRVHRCDTTLRASLVLTIFIFVCPRPQCVTSFAPNVDQDALINCVVGARARDLFVLDNIATLRAKPQFLPWFTIDDKSVATKSGTGAVREQFLLGHKICQAYVAKTGKPAPAGCRTFPQSDAQLGQNPWALYKDATLTVKADTKRPVTGEMLPAPATSRSTFSPRALSDPLPTLSALANPNTAISSSPRHPTIGH